MRFLTTEQEYQRFHSNPNPAEGWKKHKHPFLSLSILAKFGVSVFFFVFFFLFSMVFQMLMQFFFAFLSFLAPN